MKQYKLISFDMFQTLVDISTQKDRVLKSLFSENHAKQIGDLFWDDVNQIVSSYFYKISNGAERFTSLLNILEICCKTLFPKYGINLKSIEGAYILADAHCKASFYAESIRAYASVKMKYATCLISDTDNFMIEGILEKIPFEKVYTSEDHQVYKADKAGTLFKKAIMDFNIQPEEMLHIGDSHNDVMGAKLIGADAAWINRTDKTWDYEIAPDQIINSLIELKNIL